MPSINVVEIVTVAAGALVTLLLAGFVLYWIDREWRDLELRRARGEDAEASPRRVADDEDFSSGASSHD